jgi:ACR3 family arsenite transporter
VVGVLIEVPVMLMLVKICLKSKGWFTVANSDFGVESSET